MSIHTLIAQIQGMKNANAFSKYIEYIRFPYFRNLEENSKIIFDFPLTVFVGKNGTGKSSTLQAMYGAPAQISLGDYWFSTNVDPIVDKEDNTRHCFIYAYKKNGHILEVLKQRGKRKNNPEYWETSRPRVKYQMVAAYEGERNEPIDMGVEYIDFRNELTAFDQMMYIMPYSPTKRFKTRQDYIRYYSQYLRDAINKNIKIGLYGSYWNEDIVNLSEAEVKIISDILGKKYQEVKIVHHRFYKNWGNTVYLKSINGLNYTEAFSGSGETAITILINKIYNCEPNTLVLLDEPEVSIHPGAQIKLKEFLLQQIKQKKLQIIISTHSPSFVKDLPPNAIKVFHDLPSGNFQIENKRLPEEAFYYIGHEISDKKIIMVEDRTAKNIIQSVLETFSPDIVSTFNVLYNPGGAPALHQYVSSYCLNSTEIRYVIFDRDQKFIEESFNPGTITIDDTNVNFLKSKIQLITGVDIKFFVDGNSNGGNVAQQIEQMLKYLKFYYEKVFYLPLNTPEEIIWNREHAINLLNLYSTPEEDINEIINIIDSEMNYKEKFKILTDKVSIADKSQDINAIQNMFIRKWLILKDENFQCIAEILTNIRNIQ